MLGFDFIRSQPDRSTRSLALRRETRMTAPALKPKSTPLYSIHRKMGGRMVEFGGWDMPVQYPAGTDEEHVHTRTRAGLFDVLHMGELDVRGSAAAAFLNCLLSTDASRLS